jgi:DUF4097 and DUF4098 domain-containing protein YvlB
MPYCRKCGAELPKDARFCPACGTPVTEPITKPIETHKTLKVTGKPKVVVTNIAPGSIEVKKGPDGEVTVDLDLIEPEDLDCNIAQDGNMVTATCRSKVHPFHWPKYIFSRGPKADILVSVPEKTDLNLENRAGEINVIEVKGTLAAESSAGAITIQNCEGTIKARTRAGAVDLEDVNGTVSAQSSAGSIKFEGTLSKGENWFRTSVGSIEITLKGEPDLTVEASTRLGRVTCTPELTDAHFERGQYIGRIGAGTGRLIAETRTGSIVIHR